jgi:hypothetical protein
LNILGILQKKTIDKTIEEHNKAKPREKEENKARKTIYAVVAT